MLSFAGVKREALVDKSLSFVRRSHAQGRYYFILNQGNEKLDSWIPLQADAGSAAIFDPMREVRGLAAVKRSANGAVEIYLQLSPGESAILKTFNSVARGQMFPYLKIKGEQKK